MEASEMWSSLYVAPVVGVFVLAGAVYFLSFKGTKDDDNQSLKIYLNVLSGDDEKNRKAAKKLRKFGSAKQKLASTGNGESSTKHEDSNLEKFSVTNKAGQLIGEKVDPVRLARSFSPIPSVQVNNSKEESNVSNTAPSHGTPEIVTGDGNDSLCESNTGSIPAREDSGWHKAGARKEKKASKFVDDACANRSTTSEESRPSFKNSCSSRNSSPYRHRMTHQATGSRKFNNRKSMAKPPHLLQRPQHLKLESSNKPAALRANNAVVLPSRPDIVLSKGPDFTRCSYPTHLCDERQCSKLAPGFTDVAIQTEENEEFPSPLEGLVHVDVGEPRFVIMHDFVVQVDLDAEESDPEIMMRLQEGDQYTYSSGGSLSSGDGSTRVTPLLEEETRREFSTTLEKGQGVHQRNSYNRSFHRQNHHYYSHQLSTGETIRGGGGGEDPYFVHNDLRTCRDKPSVDWIDNGSRRGRPLQINGRWRN